MTRTLTGFSSLMACALWLAVFVPSADAEEIHVAVASNFTAPMQELASAFEKQSGHKLQLVFGSTGKLYAQIKNGAPFDVLLAADATTAAKLATEGAAVKGSHFTYATGKLVLWSASATLVDAKGEVLKKAAFKHLALGNPDTVPYGVAAVQTLKALGLLETLQPKFVQGENIIQTYQFVASGNAELGFVALSQVMTPDQSGQIKIIEGSVWLVTPSLYNPLHQDAVLLNRARDKLAAKALLEYLNSKSAQEIIKAYGYDVKG